VTFPEILLQIATENSQEKHEKFFEKVAPVGRY